MMCLTTTLQQIGPSHRKRWQRRRTCLFVDWNTWTFIDGGIYLWIPMLETHIKSYPILQNHHLWK